MADLLSQALAAGQDIWGQLKPKQKPTPTGPMANYGPSLQDLADVLVRGKYNGKPLDEMPWHERALTTAEMIPAVAAHGVGSMASGLWNGAGALFGDAVESAAGIPGAGQKVMDPETGSMRPEANAEILNLAATLAGGGMATTKFGEPRLGIFGGKLAKTADMEALGRAEKMAADGVHPDAIWKETGWGVGADGKWRFEIPDNTSQIGDKSADEFLSNEGRSKGKMAGVLWHKDLFKGHPELREMDASITRLPNPGHSGFFEQLTMDGEPASSRIAALSDLLSGENGAHGIMLHEAQHAVQRAEGFATGGSPKEFDSGPMFNQSARDLNFELSKALTGDGLMRPQELSANLKYADPKKIAPIVEKYGFGSVDDAINFLRIEDEKRTPFGQYKRLSGETEARNVQTRMNMTPEERRASPPWSTEDVPRDRQIVRFGNSGPQASIPPSKPLVPSLAETLAGEAPKGISDNPAFREWFAGSKAVDGEGNPVVVHHSGSFDETTDIPIGDMHFGTRAAAMERAAAKPKEDAMMAVQPYQADDGLWHWDDGAGLTSEELGSRGWSSSDLASGHGRKFVYDQIEDGLQDLDSHGITSAFLSIKNPKIVTDAGQDWAAIIKQAKDEGHDGLVYRNQYEDKGSVSYIAFGPGQIKSVSNRGTFNPLDPSILGALTLTAGGLATLKAMSPDEAQAAQ